MGCRAALQGCYHIGCKADLYAVCVRALIRRALQAHPTPMSALDVTGSSNLSLMGVVNLLGDCMGTVTPASLESVVTSIQEAVDKAAGTVTGSCYAIRQTMVAASKVRRVHHQRATIVDATHRAFPFREAAGSRGLLMGYSNNP